MRPSATGQVWRFSRRRRPRRAVVVAVACAACAAVVVSTGEATPRPSNAAYARLATPMTPTTAAHRRDAIIDAEHLLAGVKAPAGAVVQASGSGTGPHAELLTSAFASAVADRTWTSSEDPSAVLSFVAANLPAGSTVVSSGSAGPNPVSRSTIYSWPSALVARFDSLGILQPGAINCAAQTVSPIVTVAFRGGATGPTLADARVSSTANLALSADSPGWSCFPVSLRFGGHNQPALAGNVIKPIQRLLHIKLTSRP